MNLKIWSQIMDYISGTEWILLVLHAQTQPLLILDRQGSLFNINRGGVWLCETNIMVQLVVLSMGLTPHLRVVEYNNDSTIVHFDS